MAGHEMPVAPGAQTSFFLLRPCNPADDRQQLDDRQLLADTLVRLYLDRWAAGYDWDSESRSWTERYEEAS